MPERTRRSDVVDFDPAVRELLKGDKIARSFGKISIGAFFASPYMILCSSAAAIGGFLFGFDQGLISIILGTDQFQGQFPELSAAKSTNASFNQGLMTALLELGAAFGALQSGYTSDKISRRYSLMLGLTWFTVGSVLQTSAFQFAQLVIGRFIGGVGIGTLAVVCPLYIGETAPPHLRGALLVFFEWMIVVGAVIAFYVTYGTQYILSDWSFRLPFLIQIAPGLLAGGIVITMPFSPRWLVLKGRLDEALYTIGRLRQLSVTDPRVQAEWLSIQAEITANRESQNARHPSLNDDSGFKREIYTWLDLFRPGVLQRSMVGVGLAFFQQFTGINAVVYYAPSLYASLGYPRSTQLTYSGITNVLQLVGVTPAFYLMDKLGRRPLILGGTIACFVCHIIIGSIIVSYYQDWPAHLDAAKAATAFLMLYMFSFGLSWGPIPWAMPTEVCASSYRAKGVGLATVTSWVNNFIVGLITPTLVAHTHGYGAFYFFAGFLVLAFVFAYFCVPETKGVSLEEMDEQFRNYAGQEDEKRRLAVLDRLLKAGLPRRQRVSGATLVASDSNKEAAVHVEKL